MHTMFVHAKTAGFLAIFRGCVCTAPEIGSLLQELLLLSDACFTDAGGEVLARETRYFVPVSFTGECSRTLPSFASDLKHASGLSVGCQVEGASATNWL